VPYLVGFLIAFAVGLTGVGAGSITAPVLILFFGLPAAVSVGTALTFAAVIKFAVAPMYFFRRQINRRILLLLCAGGVPGVLAGVLLVGQLNARRYEKTLLAILGATIALMALYSLYRTLQTRGPVVGHDHSRWLPAVGLGIGTEVGFSSAGAGALGSLALLNLTKLPAAEVVGTDVVFGMVLSVIGGGLHLFEGHYDSTLLVKLLVGGLAGAILGANLSAVLPARPLRVALSLCLAGLGTQLCFRGIF